MSLKRTIVTVAATLALAGGVGAAGPLSANAATSTCGNGCYNWFSTAFGTTAHPSFVIDVPSAAGQPVTLARASGANPGEDFGLPEGLTPVSSWVAAGIMPGGLDALYGKDYASEIEYGPKGDPTGNCLGLGSSTGSVAGLGSVSVVTLLPCGVNARTLWIFDPVTTPTGSYYALISGTTSRNFGHPESLTVLKPGLTLFTAPLTTHVPALPLSHQLWGYTQG